MQHEQNICCEIYEVKDLILSLTHHVNRVEHKVNQLGRLMTEVVSIPHHDVNLLPQSNLTFSGLDVDEEGDERGWGRGSGRDV